MPAFGEMMDITNKTTIDELNARYAELAVARGIDAPAPTERKVLIAEIKRLEAIPAQFDEDEQPADLEPVVQNDEQPVDLEPVVQHDEQPVANAEELNDKSQVDEDLVKIHPLCNIRAEHDGIAYEILAEQASALVPKSVADDLVSAGYATLLDV